MRNYDDYIVVIGATSDLGSICAKKWLAQGGSCFLIARNETKLQELITKLKVNLNEKQKIIPLICDLQNLSVIQQCMCEFQHYLTMNLNLKAVIHSVGYGTFKNFADINESEVEPMFAVNTFSTIYFNQYFAQIFEQQGYGHIINVASMAGKIATPKSSLYSATKFAIIGYSNSLRLELADKNVYVTTVNPGPMRTKFFDVADETGNYLSSLNKFIVLEPEVVANKIIKAIGHKKREINLPKLMVLGHFCYQLSGRIGDYLTRTMFNKK